MKAKLTDLKDDEIAISDLQPQNGLSNQMLFGPGDKQLMILYSNRNAKEQFYNSDSSSHGCYRQAVKISEKLLKKLCDDELKKPDERPASLSIV